MQKTALKCDVCDGPLTMQSGGQVAVCGRCGMQYSLDRLREKLRGQQGSVQKETENLSSDFEIRAGVLVKYHGAGTEIVIPQGIVKEIGDNCFIGCQYITSVALPDGLQMISSGAFAGCIQLKSIVLPDGLKTIDDSAFSCCLSLETINIPDSVIEIGADAFLGCAKLGNIIISNAAFKRLCPQIKEHKHNALSGSYGYPAHSSYSWNWGAFWKGRITSFMSTQNGKKRYITYLYLDSDDSYSDANKFENASPWFREIATQTQSSIENAIRPINWQLDNLCRYCGGKFKGIFIQTCGNCGRSKDY